MRLGIAILVGAFLANLLGMVWYGPLFMDQWLVGLGKTAEEMGEPNITYMIVPLIGWLIAAAAMNGLYGMLRSRSWSNLLRASLYVCVAGGLLANVFVNFFDPGRSLSLVWIDTGYVLVGLLIIAVAAKLINSPSVAE